MEKRLFRNGVHVACVSLLLMLTASLFRIPKVVFANPVPPPTPSITYNSEVRLEGPIWEKDGDEWRIGAHVVQVGQDVWIDESKGEANLYAYVRVFATREADGTLRARTVKVVKPTQAPTHGVEFAGLIQQVKEGHLIVSDNIVWMTSATVVEGVPEVGNLAEVKAIFRIYNVVLAWKVTVRTPEEHAALVEFEGPIESIDDVTWVISGVTVTIGTQTIVQGEPRVGYTAEVQGTLQPNNTVLARLIVIKETSPQTEVEFAGIIESMSASQWMVNGIAFTVTPDTFIDESKGVAGVGMWAYVTALRNEDASLLATRIRIDRAAAAGM